MLDERQGKDILLLDVHQITILADYFILCSATSERHLKSLTGDLTKQLRGSLGVEGEAEGGWVLIDYGDVVVHLFLPQVRSYYNLEELWKQGQVVVHIQ